MTDGIGQAIEVGDYVAYVHRCGSSVFMDKRQISGIHPDGYLSLDFGRGRVKPHNVIKTEQQF